MQNKNYRVYTALNVAEKPSVAKSVSLLLNGGPPQREETLSQFNPVFRFDYYVESKNVEYDMLFTSVRGHIMGYAFGPQNKIWSLNTSRDLYQANIYHNLNPDSTVIKNNLINIARRYNINTLILWLDCDREGENIAFEVIEIIKTLNIRNLEILRASFSAITKRDVINAMNNLAPPNKNLSDAVEIRQKIDLIIGASFTRIQTLTLKDVYLQKNVNIQQSNNKSVISYGPCQFPTLNFIVERAEKIRKFVPEEFYYLELKLKKFDKEVGEKVTTFNWERNRIFEKIICFTILEKTLENKNCKVISVEKKEKKKYRPFPLNTVEMTKLISRKLHINSKEAMDIAEKLYRDGLISYPRTETQRYKATELQGLRKLVEDAQSSSIYGQYCNKLLTQNRYNNPKMGSGDDKAHPPIHPVRYAENDQLNAKEKKVYDLIMRHFLATLSPDAKGQETTIRVKMGEEYFKTKGLIIEDKGYLEIYIFDYWSNSYVPNFVEGEVIVPYSLNMEKGITSPPNFLTEAELISLMDKNGIGTDATIHEHIKHVQDRGYAKQYGSIFKPTLLGTSLRYGYLGLGIEIYKPYLRAGMEREIKEVSEGLKQKDLIYNEMKQDMLKIYDKVFGNLERLKNNVIKFIDDNPDFDSQILHLRNQNRRNNRRNNDNNDNDGGDDDGDGDDNGGRGRGNNGGGNGGDDDFDGFGNSIDDGDDDENNNGNKRKRKRRKKNNNNNSKKSNFKNKQKNSSSNNLRNNLNININNQNRPNNNFDLSNNGFIRYCPTCNNPMRLQQNRAKSTYFLGCTRYPDCKKSLNIGNPTLCELSDKQCINCNGKLYSAKTETQSNFICLGNCLSDNQNNLDNNNNFKNTHSNYNNNNKNFGKRKKKWKKNNFHKKSNSDNFENYEEE